MSPSKVYVTLATDALQRCSPRFQVLTLFAVFLSILLSMVYAVYLALYAPLERVVMLLALGYAGWQMQHASSVHQLPAVRVGKRSGQIRGSTEVRTEIAGYRVVSV
jgi:hypothetical protein